jgi:hypothetical protein
MSINILQFKKLIKFISSKIYIVLQYFILFLILD